MNKKLLSDDNHTCLTLNDESLVHKHKLLQMPRIIITLTLLLILSAGSFCQQTNPSPLFSQEDYLTKSKHQKTTARLLAGSGAMLTAAGMIIGFGDALSTIATLFSTEAASSSNTGEVRFYTGLVTMAGSVPLFIASSRNKKRAMSLGFKTIPVPGLYKNNLVGISLPSLSVKMGL